MADPLSPTAEEAKRVKAFTEVVAKTFAEAAAAVRAMQEATAALYGSQQDIENALLRLIETDRLTTAGARALVACGDDISAALSTAAGAVLARRGESTGI